MPTAVSAQGYIGRGETVEYINVHYQYDGPMAISAEGGWLAQQGCPFEHGYDVYFEEATLKYNSSWGEPPQLLTKDGEVSTPALPDEDGFRRRVAGSGGCDRAGQGVAGDRRSERAELAAAVFEGN